MTKRAFLLDLSIQSVVGKEGQLCESVGVERHAQRSAEPQEGRCMTCFRRALATPDYLTVHREHAATALNSGNSNAFSTNRTCNSYSWSMMFSIAY